MDGKSKLNFFKLLVLVKTKWEFCNVFEIFLLVTKIIPFNYKPFTYKLFACVMRFDL